MKNIVYIATSIDGFIADAKGSIEWLNTVPNPKGNDMGWSDFLKQIDAVIMGRKTFDTVIGFGVEWPYPVPVFVLSKTMHKVPKDLINKVEILQGSPKEVTQQVRNQGHNNIYIDGGETIKQFLQEDMIDELIITKIPVLLGEGISLFTSLKEQQFYSLKETKVFLNQLVQMHYIRKK